MSKAPAASRRLALVPKALTPSQFNRLSPMRKRVLIAQDALGTLARVKAPTLDTGCYFAVDEDHVDMPKSGSLHDALPAIQSSCTVCAKGMMFLSHVRLFNQVDISWSIVAGNEDAVTGPLEDYFDTADLDLIEFIFEGGENGNAGHDAKDAHIWYTLIPKPEDRFKEICKNIIRHGGRFEVEDFSFAKFTPTKLPAPSRRK